MVCEMCVLCSECVYSTGGIIFHLSHTPIYVSITLKCVGVHTCVTMSAEAGDKAGRLLCHSLLKCLESASLSELEAHHFG